jgi:large subunit ribosomal protein L30
VQSLLLQIEFITNLPNQELQIGLQPADHEKYGGDPQNSHKLPTITRIKSAERPPYWEKDIVKMLGLQAHSPQVHKNISSVNSFQVNSKHLVRIKPLTAATRTFNRREYVKSTGELVKQC